MSGRPSPVVIRVYQLKSDGAFAGAEFFALFDDDRKVLGAELLNREEYELAPGEQRTLELIGPPEAHFIGTVAAFQGIRGATWRALIPVDNKPGRPATSLTVVAEKQTIRIEPGH
jgi:type VI secretion system protein VasD